LAVFQGTGQVVTVRVSAGIPSLISKLAAVGVMVVALAGCSMFGSPKITQEPIVPDNELYQTALDQMDEQHYTGAVDTLKKLERQHPYSDYSEKAKLMEVFANYRGGKLDDAINAADRYIATYPSSDQMPYVLYLKGNAYFAQIKDITRDQELSRNAIDAYTLIINNYPKSEYAADARDKLRIGVDQLAGKEMSVGRYYLGNGNYLAAIGRFQTVIDQYQTSTQIEEALYRLTEANLALGLNSEAQTAAAVLGHNYPTSVWYQRAYDLLQKESLSPEINPGSKLAGFKSA
jgi:outer membrane protein assembly factor BamD